MEKRCDYGKLAMLDLEESAGKSVKNSLLCFPPLAQFAHGYKAGDIPADVPYTTPFRGRYHIPPQTDQPLTKIREGDLYFCLEQRLATVRSQVIPLRAKEFEIFALLILKVHVQIISLVTISLQITLKVLQQISFLHHKFIFFIKATVCFRIFNLYYFN